MANERTGNYPAAIASYDRGLELNPDDIELLNAKGFALFQNGDSQRAVSVLENAVRQDPNHWKSHNNLALAYVDLGDYAIAEAHFRESLAIEAQPAIYNDLGFVLERQGLAREAMESYREAVAIAPESATAHFNLASALARRKTNGEAEQHFLASIEAEPSGAGYIGLGIVQWEQGKRPQAMQSMEQALQLDPDNQQAFDQLGAMLLEVGRRKEGRAMLARARELNEQAGSSR
ncbi:MAG: tetratricopeptide repeat protein [Pseudomonadota bacterium]